MKWIKFENETKEQQDLSKIKAEVKQSNKLNAELLENQEMLKDRNIELSEENIKLKAENMAYWQGNFVEKLARWLYSFMICSTAISLFAIVFFSIIWIIGILAMLRN